MADSRTLPDLPNKKGKTNWVEKAGGLPSYIERVAKHIYADVKDVSRAIAGAVSQTKKRAAKGNKEAVAAIAQWEAMKASRGVNASVPGSDNELALSIAAEIEAVGDEPEFDMDAYNLALAAAREEYGVDLSQLSSEDEEYEDDVLELGIALDAPISGTDIGHVTLDTEVDEASIELAMSDLHAAIGPITFDPKKHPRDLRGRFKEIIGGLPNGQAVVLPDGTRISRAKEGKGSRSPKGVLRVTSKNPDIKGGVFDDESEAISRALRSSAGLDHEDSIGGATKFKDLGTALKTHEAGGKLEDETLDPSGDVWKQLRELGEGQGAKLPDGSTIRRIETDNSYPRFELDGEIVDGVKDAGELVESRSVPQPDDEPGDDNEPLSGKGDEPEIPAAKKPAKKPSAKPAAKPKPRKPDEVGSKEELAPHVPEGLTLKRVNEKAGTAELYDADGTRYDLEHMFVGGPWTLTKTNDNLDVLDQWEGDTPEAALQAHPGGKGGGASTDDGATSAGQRDELDNFFDERVLGAEYDDDEGAEYGESPEAKAVGIGIDTGGFEEELRDNFPDVESVGHGSGDGGIRVTFKDGSTFDWNPKKTSGSGAPSEAGPDDDVPESDDNLTVPDTLQDALGGIAKYSGDDEEVAMAEKLLADGDVTKLSEPEREKALAWLRGLSDYSGDDDEVEAADELINKLTAGK